MKQKINSICFDCSYMHMPTVQLANVIISHYTVTVDSACGCYDSEVCLPIAVFRSLQLAFR